MARWLLVLLITAIPWVFYACGESSDDGEENTPTTNTPNNGGTSQGSNNSETDLSMVGTLSISSSNSSTLALTLADANMDIFCTTYEEPQQTCTIPIANDGTYSAACTDFAGKPFSCYLREDKVIVGNYVVDSSANLIGGQGTIHTDATIDTEIGDISGTVDSTKSDALAQTALDAANIAEKEATSWQQSIAGEWQISCVNSGEEYNSFSGKNRCPDGETIFISEFDTNQFSIWRNKTTYDTCTQTENSTEYTEAKPNWHAKLNGETARTVAFSFDTQSNLETGLDALYAQLPDNLKSSLDQVATDISFKANFFKIQIDAIRAAVSDKFKGILEFRVPSETELKRRLILKLIYLDTKKLDDLEFCGPLINNETLNFAFKFIHSLEPVMLCQLKSDNLLDETKTFVSNTLKSSCLPKMFYDAVFDSATKTESIVFKCPGSSETDGSCFDSAGAFKGDINGRFNTLTLNASVEGIFDLFQTKVHTLDVVHPSRGVETCKIQNRSLLKGKKTTDNVFTAVFEDHFVDRCSGSGAGEQSRDFYGSNQEATIKRYARSWKATFTRVE